MSHYRTKKIVIEPVSDQPTMDEVVEKLNLLIKFMNEINTDYYPHPLPEGYEEHIDI